MEENVVKLLAGEVTTNNELQIQLVGSSGTTKSFSIKNPKSTITQEQISNFVDKVLNSETTIFRINDGHSSQEEIAEVHLVKVETKKTGLL